VQPTSREATMHVRCQMQRPTTRVFPRASFVQWIAVCVAFLGEAASPGLTKGLLFPVSILRSHPLTRKGGGMNTAGWAC